MRTLIQNAFIFNSDTRSFFEGSVLIGEHGGRNGRIIEVLPESRHAYAHLPTPALTRAAAASCPALLTYTLTAECARILIFPMPTVCAAPRGRMPE